MKKLAIILVLTAVSGANGASVTLDGVLSGGDTYTNTQTVTWYNGHQKANSIYGTFNNQSFTTEIRYGVGELAGGTPGEQYFFLLVEVPLYAKNMIWEDLDWANNYPLSNTDPNVGLTEDDVAPYRVHHETHHGAGDLRLNFGTATGSEKVVFVDAGGGDQFKADLAGNADSAFGLLGFKDSVDYLFDNNISTEELSLARDRTMSFEFQFAIDGVLNDELLGYAKNGLEFHLSPERGLIPEPATISLLALGGLALLRRRR